MVVFPIHLIYHYVLQLLPTAFAPSLRPKIHEENAKPENDKPVWWRAPAHQEGLQALLSHSTDVDCNLCMMIFSNISASIVGALRRLPLDSNSPFFVYRLVRVRDWKARRSVSKVSGQALATRYRSIHSC